MQKIARTTLALLIVGLLGITFAAVAENDTNLAKDAVQAPTLTQPKISDAEKVIDVDTQMTLVVAQAQGRLIFGGSEEALFCDDSLTGGTSGSCETDGIAGGEITCANGNSPRSINCSLPGGTGCPDGTKCKCTWSCNSSAVFPLD